MMSVRERLGKVVMGTRETYLVSMELHMYVSTKLYVGSVIFNVARKNSLRMPMTQILQEDQLTSFG
jgi:hypothetical protein